MKHFILIIITTLIIALSSSCNHDRKTVMVFKDDNQYLKIEYAGTIVFNNDNTGILHISTNGYFKCKDNESKLLAKANQQGHIVYEANESSPTSNLDENSKSLLIKAIKELKKQQGKPLS